MKAKVRYKDVAVGADANATVTTTEKTGFSNTNQIPFGVNPPALASCELNGWGLSPQYKARANHVVAFWSNELSGTDCTFANAPKITLDFTEQYTATGLTIQFGVNSFDFCRKLAVYWYQGENIKAQGVFEPTSTFFVLNKAVEAFDKLVFEFLETNLPRKRCKVEHIVIGVIRDFYAKELKSVKAIHEIDLISETVPINVLDVSVHATDEVEYIFQKKQPVEFSNDGNVIGVYYIDKGERTGRLDMSFSSEDAIGLMEHVSLTKVHIWDKDTPLETVLHDVFGETYEFDIDPAFANATLRGGIDRGKKQREALQHILFAIGAVADTTGTKKIRIFPPYTGEPETISDKVTYTGGKVKTSDTVTSVEVAWYDIGEQRNNDEIETLGQKYVSLGGKDYYADIGTYTAKNPNTVTSDPENVKKYEGCYLVNSSNAQAIANRIMDYHQKRNKYVFKHVMNGEKVTGKYTASLPWDKVETGTITRMTVTTSNIIVSDTEMLLDD